MLAGADPFTHEDEGGGPSEKAFSPLVWQRLLVIGAGPVFNLALPFVVFTLVLMAGELQLGNEVGTVAEGSAADQIGVEPGDVIVFVVASRHRPWRGSVRVSVNSLPGPSPRGVRRFRRRCPTLEVPEARPGALGVGSGRHRRSSVSTTCILGGRQACRPVTASSGSGNAIDDWTDLSKRFVGRRGRWTCGWSGPTRWSGPSACSRTRPGNPGLLGGACPECILGLLPAEIFVEPVSASVKDEGGVFTGCAPAPAPPPSPAQPRGRGGW